MKPIDIRPVSWPEARDFIDAYHRHHRHPWGCRVSVGAYHRERLVGVATIGHPVSRILASRGYLEVSRSCTILWGVNRELYKWCASYARELERPICTYTLTREKGTSLIHAGWKIVSYRTGCLSDWNSAARTRNGVASASRARWEPPQQSDIKRLPLPDYYPPREADPTRGHRIMPQVKHLHRKEWAVV